MNKIFTLILFLIFSFSKTEGQNIIQKRNKVDALNSALNFTNEGTHGMLIVHRMLENYNQDINKYVDLESFKINFYTNKDLPKDIFDDAENWFYDTSPYEWYDIAVQQANKTRYKGYKKVINYLTEMKTLLVEINQLRFDLDRHIIDKDLTDTIFLNKVYSALERGVVLYENYYKKHQLLLDQISLSFKPLQPTVDEIKHPKLYMTMVDLYTSSRVILKAIREKEDKELEKNIENQSIASKAFKNLNFEDFGSTRLMSRKASRIKNNIDEQVNFSLVSAKKFYETALVPPEYKQYGKFYYYYNSELINKFNRYGNGIVFEMNNLQDYLEIPVLRFTELPHYFKVILPHQLHR